MTLDERIDEILCSSTRKAKEAIRELIAEERLDEVTYWHKRTLREAPYPSHISNSLHAQERRIQTLSQGGKK